MEKTNFIKIILEKVNFVKSKLQKVDISYFSFKIFGGINNFLYLCSRKQKTSLTYKNFILWQ